MDHSTTKILATSQSCNIPPQDLQRAVFPTTQGRFFGSVNGKFLGTFQSKDSATNAVSHYVNQNCDFLKSQLKKRVLMY